MTFEEAMPYVRKVCRKWTHLGFELDELVNEMFLRCNFGRYKTFNGLGRHIDCRVIDYIRSEMRCKHPILCGELAHVDDEDEFENMISSLNPLDRQIMELFYRDGLTQCQIGEIVGKHQRSVSNHINGAIDRLRERL